MFHFYLQLYLLPVVLLNPLLLVLVSPLLQLEFLLQSLAFFLLGLDFLFNFFYL